MLAQDAFLHIVVLLLSSEDFEPDAILGVYCRQWGAEAIDASLGLFDVIFKEVYVHHHCYHILILSPILHQEAHSSAQGVVHRSH